ncbi:hypothetical protein [Oribacterium sp. WCC10]|uniref:hypothetical protein n=1 Tax=Oribacterium sp. WCC10 TaxID=1855343 RepID=UPI0008E31456|nr:hypothetical protein [Oribacterium sp. WCC10]SFG67359.1 hypothetical protein SAMN05216356_11843 [Oribacterium sp. WCC10]
MNSIDYSQNASWCKIPEITKDIDTFYIYSTVTMSANEGDPDYATLDNAAMLPNGVAINPLNWKRDETYAPASENLGSLVMDPKTGETEIRDIGADAQLDTSRGTVVTNAAAVANEMVEFSGPESFHQDDYSIFYNNIKDNVAKRIKSYKGLL